MPLRSVATEEILISMEPGRAQNRAAKENRCAANRRYKQMENFVLLFFHSGENTANNIKTKCKLIGRLRLYNILNTHHCSRNGTRKDDRGRKR